MYSKASRRIALDKNLSLCCRPNSFSLLTESPLKPTLLMILRISEEDTKPTNVTQNHREQEQHGINCSQRNLALGMAPLTKGVKVSVVINVPSESNSAKFIALTPARVV